MRFELPWAINNDLAGRMWPPGLEFDLCHKCSYQFVCLRLRYYQFNKLQNASLLQNRFARKVIGAVILVSNLRWAVKSDWTWDFTAILVLRKCLNALNMFEFNVFFPPLFNLFPSSGYICKSTYPGFLLTAWAGSLLYFMPYYCHLCRSYHNPSVLQPYQAPS